MQKKNSLNFKSSNFELLELLNENIKFSKFLVINEKGENLGIIEKEKALEIAKNSNLDLFCIKPNTQNPVCKIIDSSKFFYRMKRSKNNEKKSNKKSGILKEVSFSYRIEDNDLRIKIKRVVNWLSSDNLVKVLLVMKGREQIHKDIALEKCKKIILEVENESPQFQLKDNVKLIGNSYLFTFFKNKKVSSKSEK